MSIPIVHDRCPDNDDALARLPPGPARSGSRQLEI